MTDKEKQAKVDRFVAETAEYLKPLVADIEVQMPVTKDHYGRYLGILLQFEDVTIRKVVALALLAAGANPDGVAGAARNAW